MIPCIFRAQYKVVEGIPLRCTIPCRTFTATQEGASLHEIAVMLFLFITAPVFAHLLAKVALHRGKDEDDKRNVVADE